MNSVDQMIQDMEIFDSITTSIETAKNELREALGSITHNQILDLIEESVSKYLAHKAGIEVLMEAHTACHAQDN